MTECEELALDWHSLYSLCTSEILGGISVGTALPDRVDLCLRFLCVRVELKDTL